MYFATPLQLVKMPEWMISSCFHFCSHRAQVWLKQVLQAIKYRNTAFQTSKYSTGLGKFLVPCNNSLIHRGEEWSNFVTGEISFLLTSVQQADQRGEISAIKYFEIFGRGVTHHKRWHITLSGSTPNQSCSILYSWDMRKRTRKKTKMGREVWRPLYFFDVWSDVLIPAKLPWKFSESFTRRRSAGSGTLNMAFIFNGVGF